MADYCCPERRKNRSDKRAKARFNRYKKGGALRVSGVVISNQSSETKK